MRVCTLDVLLSFFFSSLLSSGIPRGIALGVGFFVAQALYREP
jgi:hypothetical protein